ncbi:hypothetical protein ACFWUZ_22465 [Streptomyces sp. NPDC058646]
MFLDPRSCLRGAGRIISISSGAAHLAFLASDDARWVTGKVIHATGGSGL